MNIFFLLFSLTYTEIQLKVGFIEKMRTTWGNKELTHIFSTISLIRKNTI